MEYNINQNNGGFIIEFECNQKTLGNCSTIELKELLSQGALERKRPDNRIGRIKQMLAYAELTWRNTEVSGKQLSKDEYGNFTIKDSITWETGHMPMNKLIRALKRVKMFDDFKSNESKIIQTLIISEVLWRGLQEDAQKKVKEEAEELLRQENEKLYLYEEEL